MAKDPSIERQIAHSRAKIENRAPEMVETERHIDRAQQALERSRILLERHRDPFALAAPAADVASGATEDLPVARRNNTAAAPGSHNAKPKRRARDSRVGKIPP